MYTRRSVRPILVIRFAMWIVLVSSIWSAAVVLLHLWLAEYGVDCSMPIAPLGTIGVAVAFYVGFKNNSSYDRSWEARKIWGGVVNASRTWGNQVLSYVSSHHSSQEIDESEVQLVQKQLIFRQLAWIHVLRFQLRRKTPWAYKPKRAGKKYVQPTDIDAMREQIAMYLDEEEKQDICSKRNAAVQLLRRQSAQLTKIIEGKHLLEEFRLISMMDTIKELFELQGKCERIKNTPFPRQYAYFSGLFVNIFITLLPFGVVGQLAERGSPMIWLTVPISAVISWIFFTMEGVGDASEDPFENFINDVPMNALCRTIEIDLLTMLGDADIPEPLAPVNDILM